jgi:soluble lytic murein transglycosylase-like protein
MTIYEVKRGDTLGAIARANNTSIGALMAANPQIKDANKINIGLQLTINSPQNKDKGLVVERTASPAGAPARQETRVTPPAERRQETQTAQTPQFGQVAISEHTVKSGENLASIAAQYGLSLAEVRAQNKDNIPNPNMIRPGQKVKIDISPRLERERQQRVIDRLQVPEKPTKEQIKELASRIATIRGMKEKDIALIWGVIQQESEFKITARSQAGARGLMQLMPGTAAEVALRYGVALDSPDELFNPVLNVRLGNHYYQVLKNMLNGTDISAIAAYNGGIGSVQRWKSSINYNDTDEFIEQIPYPETQNYVKKVFRSYWNYVRIYGD